MIEGRFVGAWRLLSCEGRLVDDEGVLVEGNEEVLRIYGESPFGQLMYDNSGHMMVVLMHPERTLFDRKDRSEVGMDAIRAAFNEFNAYCGTYTVNEIQGTITHHVEACLVPQWVGEAQLRYFEFSDGQLTLSTPPLPIRGRMWCLELVWARTD